MAAFLALMAAFLAFLAKLGAPLLLRFAGISWLIPALIGGGSALVGALAATYFGGDWWLALIAAVGLGGFALIWWFFGIKAAGAWLLACLVAFIDQRAAERGAATQKAKETADEDKAIAKGRSARADAARVNADPKRLRENDGFRRD